MSKKIIGYTVGTTLPKPSFAQTDPKKGDYIKDKEVLDTQFVKLDAQELTEEQKAQARINIGAEDEVYILQDGETDANAPDTAVIIIDPTESEFDGELSGGAYVEIANNLTTSDPSMVLSAAQGVVLKGLIDELDEKKESVENKSTELTAESTDEQYPSAKAVYDALSNITIEVDTTLSTTSTNPVQNKVITEKVSQFETAIAGLETEVGKKQPKGNYALKSEIPNVPVQSVNGQIGIVSLNAEDVGARSNTWMPTADEVGADVRGTADSRVSAHNVASDSHNDIRLLISGLTTRLNALANSTDEDLDQMAEIVEYIKSNKDLIDGITTSKVSVTDIIDNLTTNVSNKPLSAKMGVELKALIDDITVPVKMSELQNDVGYITAIPSEYITETELNNKGYLTQHQDLSSYAKKSDIPTVPVQSVNGKTGAVQLSASDVNALPSSTKIPAKISELTNDSGFITGYTESDPTVPSWAKASTKPSYTKSEVGLGNVDNVKQYSTSNPPPYPVTAVNGKTGAVTLGAADVGAATSQQFAELSKEIADLAVTPQMYGAVGDGAADDTAAINNALASGNNVFFPAGTYKITSPLIMPSGVSISGTAGLSVIKSYITSGYVLNGAGGSTTLSSPNIENLTFENGNTQDATTKLISGNFMYKATSMFMQNCRVKKYFNVFDTISNDSFIYNCRFTGIYNSFMRYTTDSVIDGNYINASRYGFPHHTKTFSGGFNSTSFINNLVDYFYTIFGVSEMASATITNNVFNRSVNVFHDTITHATISNNVFTGIQSESVDLTVLTAEQIAELEAEKWSVIKFDNNAVSVTNHVMSVNSFTNNMGYGCQYYFYVADGVQVIPANCEFRGNQISTGSKNGLSAVDAGFRSTTSTEDAYNSMKNCYFDFWDMKEYDTLPSAALIGNTAKSVVSFPYMKAVYAGEIHTNINGTWVKEGQGSQESNDSQELQPCISFAEDLSDCVDKSKIYVFPDGAVYSYTRKETVADEVTPKFTNLKSECSYQYKKIYSLSGGAFKDSSADTTVIVPVPSGITSLVVRFKGAAKSANYINFYGGTTPTAFTEKCGTWLANSVFENDVYTVTLTKGADITYICSHFLATQESDFTDFIVTINETIEYASAGETIITEGFTDTGFEFVSDKSGYLTADTLPKYNGEVN